MVSSGDISNNNLKKFFIVQFVIIQNTFVCLLAQ
jgi:hypothetical protein